MTENKMDKRKEILLSIISKNNNELVEELLSLIAIHPIWGRVRNEKIYIFTDRAIDEDSEDEEIFKLPDYFGMEYEIEEFSNGEIGYEPEIKAMKDYCTKTLNAISDAENKRKVP